MPKFIIFYMDSHLISHDNFLKELFFLLLSWHLCQKSLDCKCKGLFLNSHSYSIDFYVSTNSLDSCRFSVNSEVRKCQSLTFISHFLGCFQFLSFPYQFGNRSLISEKKNKSWNFDRVCMKLLINMESVSIWNNIKSSNSCTWMAFHLFRYSLIAFSDYLCFFMCKSGTAFVKCIP